MKTTNANSLVLAALLSDARQGTFTGLITTKVGKEVGAGAAKKRYGDDQVHVVLYTGFSYESLCTRSLDALNKLDILDTLKEITTKGLTGFVKGVPVAITVEDVVTAVSELKESLSLSAKGENESTTDEVYEPLVVNGETVRGSRVYVGPKDPTKTPAAPVGTIYLQGLKIGEKVLSPAPNGPIPASKSGPVVVVKDLLRSRLPISRYVSYKLPVGGDFILSAGGTARATAKNNGVEFTSEVEAALDRVMAG